MIFAAFSPKSWARVASCLHSSPIPVCSRSPATGDDWLHEPKWDGFRFQIIKDSAGVGFYSRYGADYTERLPRMREAFGKLPTQSAILEGELVLIEPRGAAHFYKLMAEIRTRWPDESQLVFLVFDLLHQDGVDAPPRGPEVATMMNVGRLSWSTGLCQMISSRSSDRLDTVQSPVSPIGTYIDAWASARHV